MTCIHYASSRSPQDLLPASVCWILGDVPTPSQWFARSIQFVIRGFQQETNK